MAKPWPLMDAMHLLHWQLVLLLMHRHAVAVNPLLRRAQIFDVVMGL
jgi:hypothetical protein